MATPPLYLDACVHFGLARALRERGFAVATAVEERTTDFDDESQLLYATGHGWLIITHNERHFRALHLTSLNGERETHSGIAVIPATPPFERVLTRAAMMLTWLGDQGELRGRLTKWGQLQELIEQGLRIPGFDENDVNLALGR